jgi:hypothetical protein
MVKNSLRFKTVILEKVDDLQVDPISTSPSESSSDGHDYLSTIDEEQNNSDSGKEDKKRESPIQRF